MIDPDGPLLGHPPFQVFCNFTSGSTEVLHDSETLTEVEHCHDPGTDSRERVFNEKIKYIPGCYEKSITYIDADSQEELPMSQIESLMELSETCVQSFQYDCTLGILSKLFETKESKSLTSYFSKSFLT